jgi:hypothetical protein
MKKNKITKALSTKVAAAIHKSIWEQQAAHEMPQQQQNLYELDLQRFCLIHQRGC